MGGIRWSEDRREEVRKSRKRGASYGELSRSFGIPRSTLHQWLRGTKRPRRFTRLDKIRWVRYIQPMGAMMNKKKRDDSLARIKDEVSGEILRLKLRNDLMKSVLAALYWAEGTKVNGMMSFANTDPKLMLLFVTLLRRVYKLDESKFRVRLHLHYYHRARVTRKFWSELLCIPQNQFYKTFWKRRSKERVFRKNLGGICFVSYNSVYLKERIMAYAYALGDKLTQSSP